MPTYEYACTKCGEHVEVVQSFKDDALTTCPACGAPLRKVFGNIGIVLKGSGFYKNDNRPVSKSKSTSTSESSSSSSDSKSESKSESKKDSSTTTSTKADSSPTPSSTPAPAKTATS